MIDTVAFPVEVALPSGGGSARIDGLSEELAEIIEFLEGATYARGARLYHALCVEIGDDAFFATLAAFTDLHAHSTATPEDLQAAAETAAGRNLDEFFEAWISQSELPDYDINP